MNLEGRSNVDWSIMYAKLKKSEPPAIVNSYKICVLLMIQEYVKMVHELKLLSSNEQRIIASTFIKLIQCTELSLKNVLHFVRDRFPKQFYSTFCSNIEVYVKCFDWFLSFLKDSKSQIFDTVDSESKTIVEKVSVIGRFVRKMWLSCEKSSYTELTLFWNQLATYTGGDKFRTIADDILISKSVDLNFFDCNELKPDFAFNGSKKELKDMIRKQVALVQTNRSDCSSFLTINRWIKEAREKHPECYDLFFLKYLNAERAGDYSNAVAALHEYFDWSALEMNHERNDAFQMTGWSRSLRYGPLLLAQLNRDFGHREKAISFLQECIIKAHEANDNDCLQFALVNHTSFYNISIKLCDTTLHCAKVINFFKAEYCLLLDDKENCVDDLIELSLKGSNDLSLPNIFKKTQLCRVFLDFKNGKNTKKLIEMLQSEANFSSTGSSVEELYPIVVSSLYLAHGFIEQAALEAQKFMHSSHFDSVFSNVKQMSESHCIAICNFAFCEFYRGNVENAKKILRGAKDHFCQHRTLDHLILCESVILFSEGLFRCDFDGCEQSLLKIASVSQEEASLRRIYLQMVVGNTQNVSVMLKQLLASTDKAYCRCRLLLILTDYYTAVEKNYGYAWQFANECKNLATAAMYQHLVAAIERRISRIMALTGDVLGALESLRAVKSTMTSFADQVELAKYYLMQATFIMLSQQECQKLPVEDAKECLMNAYDIFERCGALYLLKETCFHLSLVCHEQKLTQERNKWAKRFKELDAKVAGHFFVLML